MTPGSAQDRSNAIPPRGFGNCRWCGAESIRMQYLLCNDCWRIADQMQSKTQVLLKNPKFKNRFKAGEVTLSKTATELRKSLQTGELRLPSDSTYQKQWEKIVEQTCGTITEEDLEKWIVRKTEEGEKDIPPENEWRETMGIENFLCFVLRVSVLRGSLKFDYDPQDEAFCIVCGAETVAEDRSLCGQCRSEYIKDTSDTPKETDDSQRRYPGMATADIVLRGKRKK